MKRIAALAALALLLTGCGSSTPKGPAIYAQIHEKWGSIKIWRDPKGRITFVESDGELWRYDPGTLVLASLGTHSASDSTRYLSDQAAWAQIHLQMGPTKAEVADALASGSPSPEPPGYKVEVPLTNSPSVSGSHIYTDYGMAIGLMAQQTGLVLPRLASLDGYPLMSVSYGPNRLGSIAFGPIAQGNSTIDVDISPVSHRHPAAWGNDYAKFFAKAHRYHRVRGTRYAIVQEGAIFRYHGEWLDADPSINGVTKRRFREIVRAIVAARTAG